MLLGIIKNYKKSNRAWLISLVLLVSALFLFVYLAPVLAIGTEDLPTTVDLGTTKGLRESVAGIINIALSIVGLIFFGLFVYAGILWMTAGGNAQQVDKAKQVMTAAVIGLIILLLSWGLVFWILSRLKDEGALGRPGVGGGGGGGGRYYSSLPSAQGNSAFVGILPNDTSPSHPAPMNTNIVVIFTKEIDNSTINTTNVKIVKEGETDGVDFAVTSSADNKIFTLNPNDDLGSTTEVTKYTITLQNILKRNGASALGSSNRTDPPINFWVGTFRDTTPPKIVAVNPADGTTVNKDQVVQITFDSEINPVTIPGAVSFSPAFDNTYTFGDGFHAEFIPTDICNPPTNSCGQIKHCLPAPVTPPPATTTITGTITSGITDLAGNALGAGGCIGGTDPDCTWSFKTQNTIDNRSPQITDKTPPSSTGLYLDQEVKMTFDKEMLIPTFHNNIHICESLTGGVLGPCNIGILPAYDGDNRHIKINHGLFAQTKKYQVRLTNAIKDMSQNCFLPQEQTGCDPLVLDCEFLLH